MKNTTILFIFLGAIFFLNAKAQDCPKYYPTEVGATWETQSFDAKDKLTSSNKSTILSYNNTGSGYELGMETENFDKKGTSVGKVNFTMKCADGVFFFDMKNLIAPETMSAYKDMQLTFDGKDMEMPAVLTPGSVLNDASLTMIVMNQGIKMLTMTIFITNRKVESMESITVPAGTFEAYKISYDSEVKLMFKVKTRTIEYWVPGKGIVRSEQYNEKGKLVSYNVLSKV